MTQLPSEIQVWKSYPKLHHTGTWSTERYPAEAVTYVRKEDAEAAQALVVERAAEILARRAGAAKLVGWDAEERKYRELEKDIRALAPASGVAALAALRAERDELKQKLISPDPYEDTAHFDDHSVNRFAAVMKGKLAFKRLQGRGGWQAPEVPNGYLSRLLREHVDKGDPVDVANFAMMIHQRGERIAPENEGASCKAIDKAEAEAADLRARLAAAEAQVGALTEALTPNGETKAAYMGEIKDPETKRTVSWTAIKMVMAMLSTRAALATVTPPADTGEGARPRVKHHMGQIIAECDCPHPDKCNRADECIATRTKD